MMSRPGQSSDAGAEVDPVCLPWGSGPHSGTGWARSLVCPAVEGPGPRGCALEEGGRSRQQSGSCPLISVREMQHPSY